MPEAPAWVKWEASKWLLGTQFLDRNTEYVFFRLCMIAYESGSAVLKMSPAVAAMQCKSSASEYEQAMAILVEIGKVSPVDGGIFIPSVKSRLDASLSAMSARQIGAKKSRRKRELQQDGCSPDQIALIIKDEFPDDQASKKEEKEEKEEIFCLFDDQSDDQPDDLQACVDLYNAAAGRSGLAKVQSFTSARRAKLKKRLKECGGIDGWRVAIEKLEASAFLTGKTGKGWRADFDFLLQASSFTKLMEGSYDNKKGGLSDAVNRI